MTVEHGTRVDPVDTQIGAALKAARLQALITQGELAQAVGVDRTTVVKWERGQRSMTVANLLRVAQALDIAPETLLTPAPTEPPPARSLQAVVMHQQAAQTIARTLEQRPDVLPDVLAWLQQRLHAQRGHAAPLDAHSAASMIAHVQDLDLTTMTPVQALQHLDRLQQRIQTE